MTTLTWDEFVAGWLSGIGGLVVSHPIDTIKIRHQQVGGSLVKATQKLIKYEGFHGFYKGMGLPVFFAGVSNAVYFGGYSNSLRYLNNYYNVQEDVIRFKPLFLAGCAAGFLQVFINVPVENVKTQLQAVRPIPVRNKPETIIFKDQPSNITKMISFFIPKGMRSFYRGYIPTAFRDVPTGGIYIVTYVYVDYYLKTYLGDYWSHLIAGGLAGVSSYIPVTPFDAIKTRMQVDDLYCPKYRGFMDCARTTIREEGYGSLWRGFEAQIMRSFISNAAVFVFYELYFDIIKSL